MPFWKPQPRKRLEPEAELAVAALEGTSNPLEMDLRGIDTAPTSLDLKGNEEPTVRPNHCGICFACGRQLPKGHS